MRILSEILRQKWRLQSYENNINGRFFKIHSQWFKEKLSLDFAISHLVGNYSKEYLIERIEHETENKLNPGIFPSLSLGPGQRFAAKGNYIVSMGQADSLEVVGYY